MPANLPPQYFEAEKVYRQARTPEEKIEALETMLAIMPKHKGTDKLRAELRRRIAKASDEAQRRPSTTRKGSAYNIKKEGAGQVVLVGLPNSGKSLLVSTTTDAVTESADYPYTTKAPVPGMLKFENVQIQLLDMPPITAREARPWFSHLLRNSDLLALTIDLCEDPVVQTETLLAELDGMKVRLEVQEEDQLVPGIALKEGIFVGTKSDLDPEGERLSRLKDHVRLLPVVAVSILEEKGMDDLRRTIFEALAIIRVYTKSPGTKPDFNEPVVVPRGSTVEDVAESVHKDFRHRLKYAQIWGSGKYEGQRVNRNYELKDGDVVELHT
ncbi:MAG: TGS domain-containing protein [Dehalococcoidia bacterium]|nr:TGS domain-containing protein [Dehalococcoidia bacterium]